MRRLAVSIAVLGWFAWAATDGVCGSLYSVFGLGQKIVLGSAQYRSLGGGGIVLPEPLSVNPLNPAASVAFPLTRVSGTFLYEGTSLRTPLAAGWHNYSGPVAFDFHVPIGSRLGLAAGFRPMTLRDYRLRNSGTFISHAFNAETEIGYEQIREGKGGINALSFDVSYVLGERMSVGLGGRFYYGKLDDLWRVNFDRSDFRSTEDQYSVHIRGASLVVGTVIRPTTAWHVGGFFQTPGTLEVERRGESLYVYSDTVHTSTATYPAFWGIGQAVELGPQWLVVLDYMQQDWRLWKWLGHELPEGRRWYHLSIGAQFSPKVGEYVSFWKKIAFRVGVYQRAWAFSPLNGKSLLERAVTLGMGLPLPEARGRFDVALEFGIRGNKKEFPVEERFVRFVATFVAAEKWFVRPD